MIDNIKTIYKENRQKFSSFYKELENYQYETTKTQDVVDLFNIEVEGEPNKEVKVFLRTLDNKGLSLFALLFYSARENIANDLYYPSQNNEDFINLLLSYLGKSTAYNIDLTNNKMNYDLLNYLSSKSIATMKRNFSTIPIHFLDELLD